MKKAILLPLLLLLTHCASAQAPDTWTQRPDIGTNILTSPPLRSNAAAFGVGGKGYICTGYDFYASTPMNDLWEFDTLSNTWTQKATFPGGVRWNAVGFSIGTKGYIGTGTPIGGSFFLYKDFWEYNPATNTWSQKADVGSVGRESAVGFSVGNKGYIGTGTFMGSGTFQNDFWEYNQATDTWTQRDTIPGAGRFKATGFGAGGYGFIGTGTNYSGQLSDLYRFDTGTKKWTQKTSMPGTGRDYASSFGIGNKGYVGLGEGSSYLNDLWEYNTTTDTWTQKANYGGGGRYAAISMVIGNRGYMGLGNANTGRVDVATDFWQYDTTANSWNRKTDFGSRAVRQGPYHFSIGEKGYIGGGKSAYYTLEDLWEYDQQTGIWSQKANFGAGPRAYPVSFNIGAKGYVGTGNWGLNHFRDFWEYNPATNTWTQKANVGADERYSAVGFSIGNKGYIGTGYKPYTGIPSFLAKDFWEYDPTTDTWTQKADFAGGLRSSASGFSINGKGYLGLGSINSASAGLLSSDWWQFNPATNTWTQKASFPGPPRHSAAAFSVGNKGYIVSGDSSSFAVTRYRDTWEYNSYSDSWTQKASLSPTTSPRSRPAAFTIGNKGYIGAGVSTLNNSFLQDFWEYTTDYAIITGTITGGPFCSGATVSVPYTKNGSFFAGNVFTAQLSDSAGSFANPVNIGTLIDTNAGTISATLPINTITGGGYRIRVVSSSPQIFGTNNGANILVTGFAPVVTIAASPGNAICSGTPVSFNANISGGGTSPVYVWKINGIAVSTGSSFTSSTLADKDSVVCVVTSNHPCATTPTVSGAIKMAVTTSVTPSATVNANPGTTICAGNTIQFTAAIANGGTSPTYTWKVNGSTVATTPGFSSSTLSNGNTVSVTLGSNAVCATAAQVNSVPVAITVNPNPVAAITTSGATAFCIGDSVVLNAPASAGLSYVWLLNNTALGITTQSYVAKTTGAYKVALTTAQGCKDTSSGTQIIVNPYPVATLSPAGPQSLCAGGTLTLTAGSSAPNSTYAWIINGVPGAASGASYNATAAGTYAVVVSDNIGCKDTSGVLTISGKSARVPYIIDTLGHLEADTVYFAYQWYRNGTPIIGATYTTYVPTRIGYYTLWVMMHNSCTGTSAPYYVATPVSVETLLPTSIHIYPNPVQSELHVDAAVPVTLELRDLTGRLVAYRKQANSLDMLHIASGIYMLRVLDVDSNLLKISRVTRN